MAATSIDVVETKNGMSETQELVVSWGTSSLLHLGIGLLIVAAVFAVGKSRATEKENTIYIPPTGTSLDDIKDPGGESSNKISGTDEIERVRQNFLKDVKDPGLDVNGTLDGKISKVAGIQGIADAAIITLGTGGGSPNGGLSGQTFGNEPGRLPQWGERNESKFLFRPPGNGDGTGRGGGVTKVAFVLDHSGSMVDTFDFLRDEVKRTIGGFGAAQQFSVIMFSEPTDIQVLGPDHLQQALPSAKRDLFDRLDQIRASGRNDDLLDPFTKALGRAFAMNPQLIVFLTDGKFDDRLPEEVAKLNKDKKVKINTIAFVRVEKRSMEQLDQIARDNGGKFKFVKMEDLGR